MFFGTPREFRGGDDAHPALITGENVPEEGTDLLNIGRPVHCPPVAPGE